MNKHTPGPWKYLSDDGTIRATNSETIKTSNLMADYRGAIVADIHYSVNGDDGWPTLSRKRAIPEAEANAALIAAAPELAEALNNLLDDIISGLLNMSVTAAEIYGAKSIKAARAALKKAGMLE